MQPNTKTATKNINKPVYAVLLIAGIFFLLRKDFSEAVIFFGLALAFDPFNVSIPFPKRPFYQQAWLVIHLFITLSLIVITFIKN